MSSFRFLHAADIHLDSPLRGLAASERVQKAPRAAFENLIEKAITERVDFLVVAGDLYDGSWEDFETGLFFSGQMSRLGQAGIPVFVLHGNHDAESQITKPLPLPDNVRVFGSGEPETFALEDLRVALHGQSYPKPAVTDNLARDYPGPRAGFFNIGVLHTALGGREGHENYAPCSLQDLEAKGYDYWALGHVHRREIVNERPWVVFPGNLQGRHARETGPKGAYLVTVTDRDAARPEPVDLDVVRWAVIPVPVAGAETRDEVASAMRDAMRAELARADGRPLVCRLRLEGPCPIHAQLMADSEHLRAAARSVAGEFGEDIAWIERVVVETRPPPDAATLEARRDALGDLLRMIGKAPAADDLIEKLRQDVGVLAGRLRPEVRELVEDPVLGAAIEGDFPELIRQVRPWLEARLTAADA